MGNVNQTPSQITGVGGPERRVSQTLPSAVGGDEVLQGFQPLAEIRLDRNRDDPSLRVCHEATHSGQLGDRAEPALAGAGQRHDGERPVGIHGLLHGIGHQIFGIVPLFDCALILLLLSQEAAPELPVNLIDMLAGAVQYRVPFVRNGQVGHRNSRAGYRRKPKSDVLDSINHLNGGRIAHYQVDTIDQRVDAALVQHPVDKASLFRQGQIEQHTTRGSLDNSCPCLPIGVPISILFPVGLGQHLDFGVDIHITQLVGGLDLFQAAEHPAFTLPAVTNHGDVIYTQYHVLRRTHDWLTVGRLQEIARRHHHALSFLDGLVRQWHMDGHLVAIEVSIEGSTNQRMQLNGLAFDKLGHESLDTQAMKRRSPVQQNRPALNDLLQYLPDLRGLAFHETLGAFHVAGMAILHQLADDERPEKLQGHRLGQAAFTHLELRANHDDRST